MNEPSRTQAELLRTGLLGLLAILVLIGGLLWGQRINPFRSSHEIRVEFSDSDGIGNGDPVYLNGVVVGSVSKVALQANSVVLSLRLPQDLPLTDDAAFQVASLDLMGGRAVFIRNGTGTAFNFSNDIRQGKVLPGTGKLMVQAEHLLTNLDSITRKLDQLLPDSAAPLPLEQIATDIEILSGDAKQLLTDLQSDRRRLSARLESVLTNSDSLLAETRAPLRELLLTTASGLEAFTAMVNKIQDVLEQPGTLQQLASDSTLYYRTLGTVAELDSLLQAISEYGLLKFHKKNDE